MLHFSVWMVLLALIALTVMVLFFVQFEQRPQDFEVM
jgi:hypothetical protein